MQFDALGSQYLTDLRIRIVCDVYKVIKFNKHLTVKEGILTTQTHTLCSLWWQKITYISYDFIIYNLSCKMSRSWATVKFEFMKNIILKKLVAVAM